MANTLKDYQSTIVAGLGTWTYTVVSANPSYFVSAQCLENPPSGITLTIAQTGSTSVSVSTPLPGAAQEDINLQKVFNCQPGDILSVTIASTTPIDQQTNTVKTTINLRQGL